jgi:anti-sigma factor RsiW
VTCDPERVTGFVDGELPASLAAGVAAHLETCAACRAQAEAERELRSRLKLLPSPELPDRLEARVRQAGRQPPLVKRAVRFALPLAAVLVLGVWLRGHAAFVAWDLARDHGHCFSRRPLAAQVSSPDPRTVVGWFAERGTRLPELPAQVGELELVGGRFCPLASLSTAAHVYYRSASSQLSLFVVSHDVRVDAGFASRTRGENVRLLRLRGRVIGIVAGHEGDLPAFERALEPALAADARGKGGEPRGVRLTRGGAPPRLSAER